MTNELPLISIPFHRQDEPYRIFVGTMYSGENELASCIASIRRQVGVVHHHVIINGLGEREAHRTLYESWSGVKHDFDLFVQFDADAVLCSPNALLTAGNLLLGARLKGFNSLVCPWHDYLTDTDIQGVRISLPSVVFDEPPDLYCDRNITNVSTLVAHQDGGVLNPIAIHQGNPTYRQAFRYGLHRGLKGYFHQRDELERSYSLNGDDRRVMAIMGFDASKRVTSSIDADYTSKTFEKLFIEAANGLSDEVNRRTTQRKNEQPT